MPAHTIYADDHEESLGILPEEIQGASRNRLLNEARAIRGGIMQHLMR
jgi:hypothetical protein